jgi:hypothetical protein
MGTSGFETRTAAIGRGFSVKRMTRQDSPSNRVVATRLDVCAAPGAVLTSGSAYSRIRPVSAASTEHGRAAFVLRSGGMG